MFEQLRADRIAQVAHAESALATADQSAQSLRTQLATAQELLLQAEADAVLAEQVEQIAIGRLNATEAIVDERQAVVASARARLDAAREERDRIADSEPPETQGNGKPNPAYAKWRAHMRAATTAVESAGASVNAAQVSVAEASQVRDRAATEAAAASNVVAAAHTLIAARRDSRDNVVAAIRVAEGDRVDLVGAIDSARESVAALDVRSARLLAEPLDREDLQIAADAEFAELSEARVQQFGLFMTRLVLSAQRSEVLTAQDQAVAALASVRVRVAAWSDGPHFTQLGLARESLEAIVRAAQSEQLRPMDVRTDDLGSAEASLARALAALSGVVTQAQHERDDALLAVATAAARLAAHQKER